MFFKKRLSNRRIRNKGSEDMNKKTPCYNCTDRKLYCHSQCNKYQEYKDKLPKNRAGERDYTDYLSDAIQKMKGVRI